MHERIHFNGNLSTTAMGILPHRNVEEALKLALDLDIPFWPQLPGVSFTEDMYCQALEKFPGTVFDPVNMKIYVDSEKFIDELIEYISQENNLVWFSLSDDFSLVYKRFLREDLSRFKSIHGQTISPVSLALKIVDEKGIPLVYNDEIRGVIFSYIQKRVNIQYEQLSEKNKNAFVWIDDPGLEFIFNAMCGYDSLKSHDELQSFFEGVEGPRGVHLCGRPDWDFLLTLNIEVLSFNAYAFGDTFVKYGRVKQFLEDGKIICWGIVPTGAEEFPCENARSLAVKIERMWAELAEKGVTVQRIVEGSLLAPATCNLMNPDGTETVTKSFRLLKELSALLREKYLQ